MSSGRSAAPEELTANLNRVFHSLIEDLERFSGHVIYFSGDAITCWIDSDDGARATACALAMQRTMSELGEVVTPAGSRVRLAMKAAVAVGAARRFLVGDPDVQLIDVLAGRLIDALATAERVAARSEVVLDGSALESLGDRVAIREYRPDSESGRTFGVVAAMTITVDDARENEAGGATAGGHGPAMAAAGSLRASVYGARRVPRRAAAGVSAVRAFRRHRLRQRRGRASRSSTTSFVTRSGSSRRTAEISST